MQERQETSFCGLALVCVASPNGRVDPSFGSKMARERFALEKDIHAESRSNLAAGKHVNVPSVSLPLTET